MIRTTLFSYESFQFPAPKYFFLSSCVGIVLEPRGVSDPHICVKVIVIYDDVWDEFSSPFSSNWLPHQIEAANAALTFMKEHCLPDGDYGYKFTKEQMKKIEARR